MPRIQWDRKAEQLDSVSKPIREGTGLARRRNILAIAPGREVRWLFRGSARTKLSDEPFSKPARGGCPIANKIRR